MASKRIWRSIPAAAVACWSFGLGGADAVTLISRSNGLELPSKEEGRTEFEVGDVNGDGEPDLVSVGDHGSPFVNSDQHGIMVWLGDGAGTWAVRQAGNFGYGGCALGDLDGDGLTDIAWGVHHAWGTGMDGRLISAARGDGTGMAWSDYGAGLATGGEEWGMFATALADFDGDGRLDLVSQSFGGSNGLRVYRNHGDGTWSPAWALTGGSVGYTLETADVNADGHMDIVSTRAGSNVLLGDGELGFTPQMDGLPSSGMRGIAVGDIDADGRMEISCAYGSSGVRCYRYGIAGGTWTDASSGLPTSGSYELTQMGDLDGDGDLDLVAYDGPVGRVHLGDGAGHWTADATWQMPSPGDASALRVDGDLDHDGREDVVVSASMSGFPFYRNQLRVYSPWEPPLAPAVRLVSPAGGETLRRGSVRDVRWLAAIPPGSGPAEVTLDLSISGPAGPWTPIAAGLPDNGRHAWIVDAPGPATDARVRVRVTVASPADTVCTISPAGFAIAGDFSGAALPVGPAREPGPVDPASGMRLVVWPHPARDHFSVRAERPAHLEACISLHDLSGRQLCARTLSPGRMAGDLRPLDAAGRSLPAGVYLLRVTSAAGQAARSVVLLPARP